MRSKSHVKGQSKMSLNVFHLLFLLQFLWATTVQSTTTPISSSLCADALSVEDKYSDHCKSCAAISIKGGSDDLESDKDRITQFLSSRPVGKFHIQGWRWHTLSLVRDCSRLGNLMNHLLKSPTETVDASGVVVKAVDHVIDFNLKGLQRIENDLFFPWLRDQLSNANDISSDVKQSFSNVIDVIDDERRQMEELAEHMRTQKSNVMKAKENNLLRLKATSELLLLSKNISSVATSIFEKENKLLVPAVATIVPSSNQKTFNNKVLRKLGLFESRVHLVGMYDAVWDDQYGDKSERELFDVEIPALPRMMIPWWRKSLYGPQAGVLDMSIE